MDKPIRLVIAVIVGIVAFFVVSGTLREMLLTPGGAGGEEVLVDGPQMRGCIRAMLKEGADEAGAERACGCMFREFDKRGIALWDAVGERRPEMTEVTRDCAEVHGVTVEPLPGGEGWAEDDG